MPGAEQFGEFRFPPDVLSVLSAFVDPLGGSAPDMDRDDMEAWLTQRERALEDYLSRIARGVNPTGTIIAGVWSIAPEGYLMCDGTDYSPLRYGELFTLMGYLFGAVGSNFKTPDLRDKAIYGKSAAVALGALDAVTNSVVGSGTTVTTDINHYHDMSNHTHGYWKDVATFWTGTGGPSPNTTSYMYGGNPHSHSFSFTLTPALRSMSLNFAIKW